MHAKRDPYVALVGQRSEHEARVKTGAPLRRRQQLVWCYPSLQTRRLGLSLVHHTGTNLHAHWYLAGAAKREIERRGEGTLLSRVSIVPCVVAAPVIGAIALLRQYECEFRQ